MPPCSQFLLLDKNTFATPCIRLARSQVRSLYIDFGAAKPSCMLARLTVLCSSRRPGLVRLHAKERISPKCVLYCMHEAGHTEVKNDAMNRTLEALDPITLSLHD